MRGAPFWSALLSRQSGKDILTQFLSTWPLCSLIFFFAAIVFSVDLFFDMVAMFTLREKH
jgi:hypothetical protein